MLTTELTIANTAGTKLSTIGVDRFLSTELLGPWICKHSLLARPARAMKANKLAVEATQILTTGIPSTHPITLLQSVTDIELTAYVKRGACYLLLRHEDKVFLFRAGIIIVVGTRPVVVLIHCCAGSRLV
ncbi:hypothetical protein ABBQ32_007991 [Trebouxia sp. C0010 RCD-2024]